MDKKLKHTRTQALLEAARKKLGGVTDYKLAQALGMPRQRVSDYHAGTRHADAYACTRLAMILGRDPLEVIAEVEAETAKTPERAEFWKSVNFGLRRTAAGIALSVTLGSSVVAPRTGHADPGLTSHNGRLRQITAQQKARQCRAFFSWAEALPHPM